MEGVCFGCGYVGMFGFLCESCGGLVSTSLSLYLGLVFGVGRKWRMEL